MKRSHAPTLQDVADRAKVSVMMASVVLNGAQSSTRVSPATRERILEEAARLGYRRNAVARGLSRQRMDTIGVTAIIDGGEINVYFLEVINGILEGAARHGQNTTIFSVADWQGDAQRLPGFCDGRIDGMILIAPDVLAPETLSHHTPFVTLHGNEEEPHTHNLDVDNEGGAHAMTSYLIAQGHRAIAHFAGNHGVLGVRRRIAGYRRAIEEAGLRFDEERVVPGNFSAWSGRQRAAQLLAEAGDRPLPTAIFCASDAIAYGCMEVLADAGVRVPADVSVAGFDDTLTARMTRPLLTTVRQPFRDMGRCAVETLLSLIGDTEEGTAHAAPDGHPEPPTEACRTQIFPAELVVRESVAPPRGGCGSIGIERSRG
jgi:LacI family transcriptional regulator